MLARMPQVLEVWKDQIGLARVANVEPAAIVEGQARFEVERFGLTANNVTYALFGDRMLYWTFFPSDADGWGRVPAWGFATVVESRSADVREGGRIYGFVQMGGDLVLTPERVDDQRFQDRSAHRAGLPAAYLSYRFAEPSERDDATMLLQPLLVTAILLARSLEGASRVVFSSACSKTALATTYLLARRAVETAGITSSADVVSSLGVYDEVVGYDPIEGLQCGPATFVDLSGNADVRAAVHRHLADDLQASVLVGATHVDATRSTDDPLPGPEPTFFFAPDHLGDGIDTEVLGELLEWSAGWLEIERHDGPEAVLAAWGEAVRGSLPPTIGLSLSLR